MRRQPRIRIFYAPLAAILAGLAAILAGLAANPASAQDEADAQELEEIEVIGITPLPGSGLPAEKFPANVQVQDGEDIRESQASFFTEYLNNNLGSVHVTDATTNPLQQDILYRGFEASPLLGTPIGISLYQDGVRINEPFGDTTNWSLIPQSSIGSLAIVPGSNPLFGRNTLGGALVIQTKTGFSHPGTRGGLTYAPEFERYTTQLETGGNNGDWGWFITGEYFDEQGWRDDSPSEAKTLFGDLSWRPSDATELNLSMNLAETELIGNGAVPVELEAIDSDAVFTSPDLTAENLVFFNLRGEHAVSDEILLSGNTYFRSSDRDTLNGDESEFAECENPGNAGLVCESEEEEDDGGVGLADEEVIEDPTFGPVPAVPTTVGIEDVFAPGVNNRSNTEQEGYGASGQATFFQDLFGRQNQFIVGLEYNQADVDFTQSTELGYLDDQRAAVGSGFFVDDSFTDLETDVTSYALYLTDTLSVTEALAVTLSGRYDYTDIELNDNLGTALEGDHDFDRFNPAIGATYSFAPALTVFGGYSESTRAPTPAELTCADPNDPCRLPNAFVADPPLDEVVAKTFEAGFRGDLGNMNYSAAAFNTTNEDDILFQTGVGLVGQGFFDNVGDTERQGVELFLNGSVLDDRLGWFFKYTYLEAEFQEDFQIASENHPNAVDERLQVEDGDEIPAIPEHILKAGLDFRVLPNLGIGGEVNYIGESFAVGDPSNDLDEVDDYTVVNLQSRYYFNEYVRATLRVLNVFDEEYETFAIIAEEPNEVLLDFPGFENPRFIGPGAPRAAVFGLEVVF